jgi:hypothetical protein
MMVSVNLSVRLIDADKLTQIYDCFCRAYSFKCMDIDEIYLKQQGIVILNSGSTLDYRPFMGAKFFAVGDDEHVEFWGYTSDKPQPNEAKKFGKLVEKLFS